MSIYSEIDSNKRKTNFLLFGFFTFTVAIATAGLYASGSLPLLDSLIIAAICSTLYCLISYYFSRSAVLMSQGARKVDRATAPELIAMVESLAIGAGIPMPEVYVINDAAPNAFATGRDPKHAAVAVTTGLLERLNKDELKGVLAHEVSHIKNFDIRVMTIVVVLLGLVVLISDIAVRASLFGGGNRNNNNKGGGAAIFLVFILISVVLAPLIANLIRFAVSRTREYLADTTGAQLTLQPTHLASALRKISQYSGEMKRANHATAHLFISSPFGAKGQKAKGWFNHLFSTHPPIEERIKKLQNIHGDV